jgi:hypothetical protein
LEKRRFKEDQPTYFPILNCPDEILAIIFQHTNPRFIDVLRLTMTCKTFHRVIKKEEEQIFLNAILKDYPILPQDVQFGPKGKL